MTQPSSPDILIAGAGPTGLTLAIALRRYGVPVRIVDRAPAPANFSKALAVWSASLEALQGMEVVDRFLAEGKRLRALTIGDGPRELAVMKVGHGIDSPYPFPLLLPQSRTEAILSERLAALGVEIERGAELAGLAQDEEGVTAMLRHGEDGRMEEVRSRYLVGCDGARSFVRQALGIAFEGYTEPQTFLLGDVIIEGGALDHQSIYLWWHEGGTVALFPFEASTWRVFALRESDAGDKPPALAELQDLMDRHGPGGLRLADPRWLSAFRINERLAARYRDGRCFIAGDAAHIHSPAGGQGMNTGIQDAVNLGWKLAFALQGAGERELLLDSYEAERRPIAREVIKGAAQKLHLAFGASRIATLVKDVAVSIFGNIPAVQRKLQVELSETTLAYREGPLVALGDPPRRPKRTDVGSRALDAAFTDPATGAAAALWTAISDGRHSLLLFEDEEHLALDGLAQGCGERLQILRFGPAADPEGRVRKRYRLRRPGWVLIRPDQVVAARGEGSDVGALKRYIDRVIRPS
jgi:2-polyprenyl-6-methoxyphenol hydroxylase-like FAD-dependent oxidoreductase